MLATSKILCRLLVFMNLVFWLSCLPLHAERYLAGLSSIPVEPNSDRPVDESKVEALYWQSIMNDTHPGVFETYLKKYPNGAFSELARIKIAGLKNEPAKSGADSGFRLTVDATPPDSRIKIVNHREKYQKGMTLKPGKYQVEVYRPGYQTSTQTVTLDQGDVVLPVTLTPLQKGGLRVTSDPAGAAVIVDGKKIGETPLEIPDLPAGQKKVEIQKECFEPANRTITIAAGQQAVAAVQLTAHCGAIHVTGEPSGADVFIDNVRTGSLPAEIAAVSAGNRHIQVKKEDFQDFEKSVTVQTGKTTTVSVSLKKAAKFMKLDGNGSPLPSSAPSWSMVQDNETGLVWEVKHNKDGVKNYDSPDDADNTYSWYDGEQKLIAALNTAHLGGFSDWRLPTLTELKTLVVLHRTRPEIYATFFPDAQMSFYWSSTVANNSALGAWGVNFGRNGYDYYEGKYGGYYVRAVRGKQ
jgi:hypothetical protein